MAMNEARLALLKSMMQQQQGNVNVPQSPFAALLGGFLPTYGISKMANEDEAQKKAAREKLAQSLSSGDEQGLLALTSDEDVGDQAANLAKYQQDKTQFGQKMEFEKSEKQKDRDLRMSLARELAAAKGAKAAEPKPLSNVAQKQLLDINKKYGGETVLGDAFDRMETAMGEKDASGNVVEPYSGYTAPVASIAAKIPFAKEFVDKDRIGKTESMDKLADTLSLQYLESFGGSDTEREQKIARELSALPTQSKEQRDATLKVARESLAARKGALARQRQMILTDPSYRGGNNAMIIQEPSLSLGVLDE